MEKVKVLSSVSSFTEVQKSLQEVEKALNQLIDSTSTKAETEVTDTEGETGDIQITQNADKTYTFEIRTEEGWKTPVIGDSAVKFKDKPAAKAKEQKKSIDEIEVDDASTSAKVAEKTIFDEKADKFIAPRADYDSGWIDVDDDETIHTLTHNLGVFPKLWSCWYVPDADYNSGDPSQIFLHNMDVGMRGQDSWAGMSAYFTKTEMKYRYYDKVHVVYGVVSDSNAWTKMEDGYIRVFLWK